MRMQKPLHMAVICSRSRFNMQLLHNDENKVEILPGETALLTQIVIEIHEDMLVLFMPEVVYLANRDLRQQIRLD